MQQNEITALFDQLAPHYDSQWQKMAPIRNTTELLVDAIFANLPSQARILCVGSGTGSEIIHMANQYPGWHFTAVEPSAAMMAQCQKKLRGSNLQHRCHCHQGYLQSLTDDQPYDAATAILVSQFITDTQQRSDFFQTIAQHLTSDGILVSCDLSANLASPQDQDLLEKWFKVMQTANMGSDDIEQMRTLYQKDLAIIPDPKMRELITQSGFEQTTLFLQAGLIKGWYSRKARPTAH